MTHFRHLKQAKPHTERRARTHIRRTITDSAMVRSHRNCDNLTFVVAKTVGGVEENSRQFSQRHHQASLIYALLLLSLDISNTSVFLMPFALALRSPPLVALGLAFFVPLAFALLFIC